MSNNGIASSYDNEWTISVTNCNASLSNLQSTKGAFLGNGKVGYITAMDRIGVQKSLMSVDFDFNEYGIYKNNVTDGFDITSVKFFDNYPNMVTAASNNFIGQSLNMFTGICTSQLQITNTQTNDVIDVSYDLYPVRNLPYCTVQTINITPHQNMSNLEVYHEVGCSNNVMNVEYNNNVLYNDLINSSGGLYMLSGKGVLKDTGKTIAVSSSYCLESSNISPVGFNVYATDVNKCFQKLVIKDVSSNVTYRMHIISAEMTEYDFKLPLDETKRILVNVLNSSNTTAAVSKVRQTHVKEWSKMWVSNISIIPKAGITDVEQAELNSITRVIRYSLYNIWSAVREGIRTELNPQSLSIMDTYGTLFWDGDLWFIPVLTLLRPSIAKNMLEARYTMIDRAMKLASGYGYNGSKFPYVNDVVGYTNVPYWDVRGPMHIFNTALITISVWNYYRVSQDRDWLLNKGYTIMKNNSDFFTSKLEVDEDGTYHIRNVYSFHDKISDDNTLTNYLVKAALKNTIEASYELSVIAKDEWVRAFYNLDTKFYPCPPNPADILMLDAASTPTDTCKFLEHLVPLLSYYSRTFFAVNPSRDWTTIQRNIDVESPKIETAFQPNPMNNMILSWLTGTLTNYDASYPNLFNESIKKIIDQNVQGIWGNFSMNNSGGDYNDLSLSSLFILHLLCTSGTLRVTGSVSETRFYAESMGIHNDPTCSMPKTWKAMRLTGVGQNQDTFNIINQVFYP
jgi:trehalose/maltose hydrolase-like predicted phosphorylase